MIELKLDVKQMKGAQELLGKAPKKLCTAVAAAILRATNHIRSQSSVMARKRYDVKAKDIKSKGMDVQKPNPKKLLGIFRVSGTPMPLTSFNMPRVKRGPVKVKVLQNGSPKPVKGLFIREFPKGYTGPMRRVSKASYPLETPRGPSVPQMIGHKETLKLLETKARDKLIERVEHEIHNKLGRIK